MDKTVTCLSPITAPVTSTFQVFSNKNCCVRLPLINYDFNIGNDDAATCIFLLPYVLHTHLEPHCQVSAKSIS